MSYDPAYFEIHSQNLKILNKAIDMIKKNLHNSIREEKSDEELYFTRILSWLLVCWTEVRLYKLVYEGYGKGFSNGDGGTINEINEILSKKSDLEKWEHAFMLAFKRSYGISNINNISDFHTYINDSIENSNLSKDEKKVFTRIQDIINIINGELKNSKEIRNKVGHGQWIFAVAKVNSSENPLGIDLIKTVMIGGENKLTLINKKVIFENLSILIEYMIVSPKTKSNAKNAFEKHFDRYYNIIKSAYIDFYESENDLIESSYNNIRQKYNIFTESSYYRRKLKYEEFKKKVIDRKKRGIDYKRRNINKKFKVLFLSFFIFSILGYLTIHYFFIG